MRPFGCAQGDMTYGLGCFATYGLNLSATYSLSLKGDCAAGGGLPFVRGMPVCYSAPQGVAVDIIQRLEAERKALFVELDGEIGSKSVLGAMEQVPRERFVPPDVRSLSYQNIPLSIGSGQTISQPYMVARMTELLELRGDEKVLEVGTGSGYQAAILSLLLPRGRVVSVEREPVLAEAARARLEELGCDNVVAEFAGPVLGCPDQAPFDAIIVTAACPGLPDTLVGQLAVGGRLVAPVGPRDEQSLILARRTEEGLTIEVQGKCRFVPLLGPEGFGEG